MGAVNRQDALAHGALPGIYEMHQRPRKPTLYEISRFRHAWELDA